MNDGYVAGEIPQGFGAPPLPTYVYIKGDDRNQTCWHKWNHQANGGKGEAIPIEHTSFYGKFIGFRFVRTEFKGDLGMKLEIQMSSTSGNFNFRSGVDTLFTRGFVLAAMNIEDWTEDYCLAVQLGSENNVVFCRLYLATGAPIRAQWDKEANIPELINELQHRTGSVIQNFNEVLAGKPNEDDAAVPAFSGPPQEGQPAGKAQITMPAPNRPMPDEFYATDANDVIAVGVVGKIQVTAGKAGVDDHDFSMEVFNCPVQELSKKGGDELLKRLENLSKKK